MEVFRRNAQPHIADMRKEGLGDTSPTSKCVSGAPDALLATEYKLALFEKTTAKLCQNAPLVSF